MNILVTGSNGFVGKNLVTNLKLNSDFNVYEYDVDNTIEDLDNFCKDCDFVVNLAGINRTSKIEDFINGNFGVISEVVNLLKKHNNTAPIIYSSSIQALLDNDYGKSKKLAEDFLLNYQKESGNKVYIYRLPNIFGKWCKPNYNSVIATFCYNIANNLNIRINDPNVVLTLVYIDDLVKEIINAIHGNAYLNQDGFYGIETKYTKNLGEIAKLIYKFAEQRKTLYTINTADEFEKKLYSTYLSYLPEDRFLYDVNSHTDARGSFTELLKTESAGQFSVNLAKPGIVKGNHWHNTKNEKFIVIKGDAEICFRKVNTEAIIKYNVSGKNVQIVDIPCGYTHSIKNIGKEDMLFVIWCNECFDPENPDTYYLEV